MARLWFTLVIWIGVSVWFAFGSFVDSVGHQYQDAIDQLFDLQIVQWYPDQTFRPDQAITRAEMLKIIMLAADISINTDSWSCFPDVRDGDRFVDYVCTARAMNIIQGYDDGTFRPNLSVSFVEGIKIGIEWFGITTRAQIWSESRYARYMDFVHDNTIFSRYSVYPERGMTRAMMAHLATSIINQWSQPWSGVRNHRSAGCKAPSPISAPSTIMLDGVDRSIITDVWPRYQHGQPARLIVAFHGRTNPNTMVRSYYRLDRVSDGNTIIVYPAALPEEWPVRNRANPWDKPTTIRDYALFDEIVETFADGYCIDQDEIYVVWHSLGGRFANNLACARGHVIRGVWSVGGSMTIWSASCTWPVSTIIMHNPEDHLAWFAGGVAARNTLLNANQCNLDEYRPVSSWPEEWHCVEYTSCIAWSQVVRCPYTESIENGRYYPHKWPSFAAQEIWRFFVGL